MSITVNLSQQDTTTLIVGSIKQQMAQEIYTELNEYIQPRLREIAFKQAEAVCKEAVIQIERDLQKDQVVVWVQFGKEVAK